MNISIVSATENPVDVISRAAGTSYGKNDVSEKRVLNCFKLGHMSVFEHAFFTVRIEGISRACSHQLVRHRLASFVQQSQRYTKIDTSSDDWYVMPESFVNNSDNIWRISEYHFKEQVINSADMYNMAINDGIKPEDARYLLPEATKTTITMTMNVRELFTFLDLRTDEHAQWEIRKMAASLYNSLLNHNQQWRFIMGLWVGNHG